MTEAEAKTRPCIGPNPYNTGVENERAEPGGLTYLCAGATCLAWCWGPEVHPKRKTIADPSSDLRFTTTEPARRADVPDSWEFQAGDAGEDMPAAWVEPAAEAALRRQGWCGLVRKG